MTTTATPTRPETKPEGEKRHGNMPMNMVTSYVFFQLDSSFRKLPQAERQAAKKEVSDLFANLPEGLWCRTYSTFGFREDADFFVWFVTKDLNIIHQTMTKLYQTSMGAYLSQSYNYIAVSKESPYVSGHEHEVPPNENAPLLFVYPFIKNREWYLLPFERRMEMMKQHIAVGHEFPNVTINTAYSFGIDDQDFVVAFDGHTLQDFVNLVMKLRETEASRYTECDKPMFVGLKKPMNEVLDSLGI